MRALLLGDIHLADRPPSARTEDYAERILEKLRHCADEAINRKVDALILAGDVFHIKRPDRTSHGLVQKTITILTQCMRSGIRVAAVPGNHDMLHDRLDSLERQPLGVLFKASVEQLTEPHPDLPIFGIPFLQEWRDLPNWTQSDSFAGWSAENGHRGLVVSHAPIMPPGRSAPYEYISADQWANLMAHGNVYYGHIHDLHGAYRAGDEGLVFCNQGAISRGSLHESDLGRAPAATLFNSEEEGLDRFQRIPIPHRPADEVYALERVREDAHTKEGMAEFIRRIGATKISAVSTEALTAHLDTLDIEPVVKQAVRELVEDQSCA